MPYRGLVLFTDGYLSHEPGVLKPFQYSPLLQTLSALIRGPSTNGRDLAVKSLEGLLPRAEVRKTVWTMPAILEGHVSP
jgi:V-type H+-transporting ATPase subunit H